MHLGFGPLCPPIIDENVVGTNIQYWLGLRDEKIGCDFLTEFPTQPQMQ